MADLPAPGYRIQPEHAVYMPKLVAGERTSPVLRTSDEEVYVQLVNPASDQIVFDGPHGFGDDAPISFFVEGTPPGGLTAGKTYYVRLVSPTAIQLAETKGGPAIDLLTAFTGKHLRATSIEPGSRYVLRGIELTVSPNAVHEYELVQIGAAYESSREAFPYQIELDRVYIHGIRDQNGPRVCLVINARQFKVSNSRLEHCNKEGEESKAILIVMAPGPGLLANNYIEAGSINLLIGGDYLRIPNIVSGDEGGIEIFGNHFHKPLRLKYTAGTGGADNPSGRCTGMYLNSTTGQWFECDGDSKWVAGPVCARGEYYRRTDVAQNCGAGACWECSENGKFAQSNALRPYGYNVKNLFEVKSGMNIYVHGNVFENNWVNSDQSGVAVWVVSQVSQVGASGWVRGENILFTNNIIRNSTQGIRVASEGSGFGMPNRNVRVVNNLLYDIGATANPSIASSDARPISFAGECVDCQFVNNTTVSGVRAGTGIYLDTKPMTGFRFTNNVASHNLYGFLGDGGLPLTFYAPAATITNNVLLADNPGGARFAPGTNRIVGPGVTVFTNTKNKNFRLHPDSPFSSACVRNCEYTGDDRKDLGADIDRVEAETSGAVAGVPNWIDEFGLTLASVESQKASLVYWVRTGEVCSLRVSTNPALRTAVPDTDAEAGDNRSLDNREGNTAEGPKRTFVVGTVDPLRPDTQHYFKLTCGNRFVSGAFRTSAAP